MSRGGRTGARPFLWTVAVFAIAFFFIERGIEVGHGGQDQPAFFIDEAHKLSEAYYFHLFFEQRDVRNRDWHADFYARTNPPVAKYIFGTALALTGKRVESRKAEDDFGRLWAKPWELRRLVPDDQLRVTRRVSAFYAALTCAALFLMAFMVSGPVAGIATVVLLLENRFFLANARRGMADSILLFHVSLIGPVAIGAVNALSRWWSRDPRLATAWNWIELALRTVVLPGLVIALAAGSKLNGAITAPIYLLCLFLVASREQGATAGLGGRLRTTLATGIAASLIALAAFVAINPYFYGHPIRTALDTLSTFEDWMVANQLDPGEGLFSARDRFAAMFNFLFTQAATPFGRWLGRAGPYWGAFVTVFGASALLLRQKRVGADRGSLAQEGRDPAKDVVFVWALVCLIVPTAWAPVSWDRYFLPPYLAGCLLAGIGVTAGLRVCLRVGGLDEDGAFSRDELRRTGVVILSAVAIAVAVVNGAWGRNLDARPEVWDVPGGIPAWSDSARLRHHLALTALYAGQPRQARAQLERALELIPADPGDRSQAAVGRAYLLYELSGARSKAGDPRGAMDALSAHIALLERFRNQMKSVDPAVLSSNEGLIWQRKEELAKLQSATDASSRAMTAKPLR